MEINVVSVQYNGGLLLDIILLLTRCGYIGERFDTILLLGMVEARSVNVNNTTTKTSRPQSCCYFDFLAFLGRAFFT